MTTPDEKNISLGTEKKYASVGYENVTPSRVDTSESSIQYGIEFILSHLRTTAIIPKEHHDQTPGVSG